MIGINVLVVKTIEQVINTYEVPDVLTGDFFRWMARRERHELRNYVVDKQQMDEIVVYAYRSDDSRPGEGEGQTAGEGNSEANDEGIRTK